MHLCHTGCRARSSTRMDQIVRPSPRASHQVRYHFLHFPMQSSIILVFSSPTLRSWILVTGTSLCHDLAMHRSHRVVSHSGHARLSRTEILVPHAIPYLLSKNITGLYREKTNKSQPDNHQWQAGQRVTMELASREDIISITQYFRILQNTFITHYLSHTRSLDTSQICDFFSFSFSLSSSSFIPFMIHPLDFLA